MRLDVIVPCYNPLEGWAEALAGRFSNFKNAVADLVGETRLIVVNDGSLAESSKMIFKRLSEILPEAKIIHYAENRGKGHALRQGVSASDADFHLLTDADFPYTLDSMQRVAAALRERGGIVAGNRDTAYYANVPTFRRWLSKALRWLLRNVLRQPIGDSQCGLKGFDNQGKKIFLETTIERFLFDLEFLMLANGRATITPVPVELREGVVFSKVGWKILAAEGKNFLWLLLRKK